MVEIGLENVSKSFGQVKAVDRITFTVRRGELFFLLGPSGCGKTTLLRLVAGFETPDGGRILFDGRPVTDTPPNLRNTGMVFQNYALWPHRNVFRNVSYGLEVRRVGRPERQRRVLDALELVRLKGLESRQPTELSGGQQQRVALARALVINPDVVLLDEPLSNLDAKLRLDMRREIKRIHEKTGITMLYVTHDQKEALSLAERLAVLRDGRIEQIGAPEEVYRRPANAFVAEFIGQANLLPGKVSSGSAAGGKVTVMTALGPVVARGDVELAPGGEVVCSIRPESVNLRPAQAEAGESRFRVTVAGKIYLGDTVQYELEAQGGVELQALLTGDADPGLRVGDAAVAGFAPDQVRVVRK